MPLCAAFELRELGLKLLVLAALGKPSVDVVHSFEGSTQSIALFDEPLCLLFEFLLDRLRFVGPSPLGPVFEVHDEGKGQGGHSESAAAGKDGVSDQAQQADEETRNRGENLYIDLRFGLDDSDVGVEGRINTDFHHRNVYFPPEQPPDPQERPEHGHGDHNLNDGPDCDFPAGVFLVGLVQGAGEGLDEGDCGQDTEVYGEPHHSEVHLSGPVRSDIEQQEEGLHLHLEEGDEDEQFADDGQGAAGGLLFVGVEDDEVDVHQD
jgi:hypothetical protein